MSLYGDSGGYVLADLGHVGALPSNYGEAVPSESESDLYALAAKAAGIFTEQRGNTPEELRARIANLKQLKKSTPLFGAAYDVRIQRLQGRLKAMEREERETTEWRTLGQTASQTSILVGLGVFMLLSAISWRVVRGGRKG